MDLPLGEPTTAQDGPKSAKNLDRFVAWQSFDTVSKREEQNPMNSGSAWA
jgi:hypothetical protein